MRVFAEGSMLEGWLGWMALFPHRHHLGVLLLLYWGSIIGPFMGRSVLARDATLATTNAQASTNQLSSRVDAMTATKLLPIILLRLIPASAEAMLGLV